MQQLFRRSGGFVLATVLSLAPMAEAGTLPDKPALDTPRFTLYFPQQKKDNVAPTKDLAKRSIRALNSMYEEIQSALGEKPTAKVVLRFMSPGEFHRKTGAPEWTSAMFLRGEISIPLADSSRVNFGEMRRAIRHEYVHAVVSELSAKKCPAWLDEGLAQLFEGEPNPLLGPALRSWIVENEAMPLTWLQNGFMTLDEQIVPVAYAQSLFATRQLVEKHGFGAVTEYLTNLKRGQDAERAFKNAFGIEERRFERELTKDMRRWVGTGAINP